MQAKDRDDFNALIASVMAYYKQDVSKFALGLWWEACADVELEQVAKAMSTHAKDPERGQYPPKVADIVRLLQGTPTDRAQLAWGKVLDAIQRVGNYSDVVFDDPAIHAVVEDLGGWPKVCRCTYEELSYLQHRFVSSHQAYVRKGEFEYPRMLGGERSPDSAFLEKGLPVPKPVVIGNIEQARLVYKGGSKEVKRSVSIADLISAEMMKLSSNQNED